MNRNTNRSRFSIHDAQDEPHGRLALNSKSASFLDYMRETQRDPGLLDPPDLLYPSRYEIDIIPMPTVEDAFRHALQKPKVERGDSLRQFGFPREEKKRAAFIPPAKKKPPPEHRCTTQQNRSRTSPLPEDEGATVMPSSEWIQHGSVSSCSSIPDMVNEYDNAHPALSTLSAPCSLPQTVRTTSARHLHQNDTISNHGIIPKGPNHYSPPAIPRPEIEVAPGVYMMLHGSVETMQALQENRLSQCICMACTMSLYAVEYATFVLCPTCRVVSPKDIDCSGVEASYLGAGSSDRGVGLGLTEEVYEQCTMQENAQVTECPATNQHRQLYSSETKEQDRLL